MVGGGGWCTTSVPLPTENLDVEIRSPKREQGRQSTVHERRNERETNHWKVRGDVRDTIRKMYGVGLSRHIRIFLL